MAKYLDWGGLQTLWTKIKSYVSGFAYIVKDGSLDKIYIGPSNIIPVEKVSAGAGLNTTSDDCAVDGGHIGEDNNSGTLYLTKSGVTAGSYGPSTAATPAAGSTFNVPYLTVDKYGRVTAAATNTVQIPDAPSSFNISVTDDILDGTGGANSVKYAPYGSKAAGKLYTGTTNPTSTNRLNYDGYFYGTKLYSGGSEVLTSVVQDGITGATVNRYGVSSNAADVATKTVSITSGTVPTLDASANGLQVLVKFSSANTAGSPTLNVDSKGAKKIYHRGTQITTGTNKALLAGVCAFVYDNSLDSNNGGWHLIGNYYDTTYTVGNKALKVSSDSGTATQAITMNESSADKTLQIKGDGTYLEGAVSGSAGAPVVTISHKDPVAANDSELTAAISGTAGAYALNTEYTVLTGVKAQRDAKGHVTGLTYTAQKVKDTNVDTKVTSVANHYAPSADENSELTASIDGTAGAYAIDTEYTVLTGVKAQRDAKGHVTGLTYTAQKVKDTNTTYTLGGLMGSSAKGSGTQPIYWTGSAFANTTYTLGKSVPSDAVFTDQSVTAVGNHYTPEADENSELTATISETAGTYAIDTEYTLLTGVKAQRDAKGHVTGLTYTAQKVKDTNTDTKVNVKTRGTTKAYLLGTTTTPTSSKQAVESVAETGVYFDTTVAGLVASNFTGKINKVDIKSVSNGFKIIGGTTSKTLSVTDSYTLGDACAKSVDTSIGSSSSSNLPTTDAVKTYVSSQMSSVVGALVYKGVITSESTLLDTALTKGWYYIVNMPETTPATTNITIGGVECESGDMIIVNTAGTYTTSSGLGAAIDVIQSNIAVITDSEINGLS